MMLDDFRVLMTELTTQLEGCKHNDGSGVGDPIMSGVFMDKHGKPDSFDGIAERIVAPILRELMVAKSDISKQINKAFGSRRLDFTAATTRTHIAVIEAHYMGRCPCCKNKTAVICAGGKKLSNAEDEHFFRSYKRELKHTWIVCHDCNLRLENPEFHTSKQSAFSDYQDWVSVFLDESTAQLNLLD